MPAMPIEAWIEENAADDVIIFAKRLSRNDTQATNAHQAGPYIQKQVAFELFPEVNRTDELNPRVSFPMVIDSHVGERNPNPTLIYYNSRRFREGGTRNETRITGFGGQVSPFLDPANTGSVVALAFRRTEGEGVTCSAWVCESPDEEEAIEDLVGPIDPGRAVVWSPTRLAGELFGSISRMRKEPGRLEPEELPESWRTVYPTGAEIIAKTVELMPARGLDVDRRLLRRRDVEWQLYQSIERAVESAHLNRTYEDLETLLKVAQSIHQRRRSRAGNSLEYHVREILREEGLVEGTDFGFKQVVYDGPVEKRPDLIFPNADCYADTEWPASRLRILAAKTTLKDRWRQVSPEADRVTPKHLLTLQEGVSVAQFREMTSSGITLVVPAPLHEKYPASVQPGLMTLEGFIAEIRLLRR
ncbi:type II restriction endonuclease [Aurantimonas coralicida]|uniref:type II restriction endonuclease n=1 Tax=Aurantimonas coralicida TaxID=182270 RepID=UPI001D1803D6|nr:type II restriction endonuclease [Aurantimonas coralicida]MCC4296632.1 type II restriction endonuclease [Aurantimonas coralicida]